MDNIAIEKPVPASGFRKLAMGAWKHPANPSIYARMDCDISACKRYIQSLERGKHRVSINHVMAKIISILIQEYPELNRVKIRSGLYQRKENLAFFITHINGPYGYDLYGVTLKDNYKKSLPDIAEELYEKSQALKKGEDAPIRRVVKLLSWIPLPLMSGLITVFDFFLYTLNWHWPLTGLPKDRYGSVAITSVGSLGFQEAAVPLFPFSRTGLLMSIGKPFKKVVSKNNEILVQDTVTVCFTLDHRLFDGAHFAKPLRKLRKILRSPELYL